MCPRPLPPSLPGNCQNLDFWQFLVSIATDFFRELKKKEGWSVERGHLFVGSQENPEVVATVSVLWLAVS